MNRKDMEQLVDSRVNELYAEVEKKYSEELQKERDEHKRKVKEWIDFCIKKGEEFGFKCYKSTYGEQVSIDSIKYETRDKISAEKAKISKEASELKRRVVIMGLKNKNVADVLMKYLGMEN